MVVIDVFNIVSELCHGCY